MSQKTKDETEENRAEEKRNEPESSQSEDRSHNQ